MDIGRWEVIRFIQSRASAWAAAAASLVGHANTGQITTTINAPRVRPATETRHGKRSGTVAQAKRAALKLKRLKAKRAALKLKRLKAHRRNCR
jgi:hypothetical protein